MRAELVFVGSPWYSNAAAGSSKYTRRLPRRDLIALSSQMWMTPLAAGRPTEPLWANHSSDVMAVLPKFSVPE